MDKNIYDLLNDAEINLAEYGEESMSSDEKNLHKQRIAGKIKTMEKSRRKNKMWRTAAGLAAAVAITVGVVGFSNTTLAKEFFSKVFGNLIENTKKNDIYSSTQEAEVYQKIGEHALPVQKELEKQSDSEDYVITATDKDIKVSVSDVYCDGYILYYTLVLESANKALEDANVICPESREKMACVDIEGIDKFEYNTGYSIYGFNKAPDGTYVSMNEVFLAKPVECDSLIVDLTIPGMQKADTVEDMKAGSSYVDGEWKLRFPVSVDKSAIESFILNIEENGIVLKNVMKTNVGLYLEVELADETEKEYMNPNCLSMMTPKIKDKAGNYLTMLHDTNDWEDGKEVKRIMCLYDGQKELSLEVEIPGTGDNPEPPVPVAEIEFQIP